MQSWCVCGGLLNGLDQDFDLCSGSLLRWHSLLNWSSQLVAMGFDGLRRLEMEWDCVCDPKVRGALLFRCMVVRLCWHFSNFPWLCKVFLQTFLHFASQFRNLKAISMLGGDFAAISKFGDHFTAISKLGDHFIAISQLKSDFAAQNWFRSSKVISQLYRNFEMMGIVLKMALVCQKVVS